MRKIVLDTNCLLQILPSISPYHSVWTAIVDGSISLCVNMEILEEYEEIIGKKITPGVARNVVEAIARLSSTCYQEAYFHFGLIEKDVDDNKFVDCAIASEAEYVVSNDAHFKVLKKIEWPKVEVLSLEQYYRRFTPFNRALS